MEREHQADVDDSDDWCVCEKRPAPGVINDLRRWAVELLIFAKNETRAGTKMSRTTGF